MATSESDIAAKAVVRVLEEVQKNAPWENAVLNAYPQKKEAIIQAARSAAIEQVKLAKEFAGQPEDITERLAKHLPGSRIKMIQEALNLPTFRMDITKESDGKHWVHLTRDNQPFKPSRELAAVSDINWATIMQYASIIVEAVALSLSAVGISISPESSSIEAAIEDTVHAIQTSTRLGRAVQEFVTAWKAGGGSKWQRAKAIFKLIKDTYLAGILWTSITSLCSNMSTTASLKAASLVTAMIIAALATDGAALVAEIALVVMSAVDFAMKIENVVHLNGISQGKQSKLTLRPPSRHLEVTNCMSIRLRTFDNVFVNLFLILSSTTASYVNVKRPIKRKEIV